MSFSKLFGICLASLVLLHADKAIKKTKVDVNSPNITKKTSSIVIPEEIKKQVPKDQQSLVFFNMIWQLLKNNYVEQISDMDILEKSIKGVLGECDPHTAFLDEKTLKTLKESTDGSFGGIGIEIVPVEGFIKILHPIEGSPGFKALLKPGDIITHVNGEFIYKEIPEIVISKMKGKPGTYVNLTIKRKYKAPFDVTIKRDTIKIPFLKHEMHEDIGYLRIGSFYTNLAKDTKTAVEKFLANKKLKGIVIDLRYNSGGLLTEAVGLSNLFLKPEQEIVSIIGRTGNNLQKKSIFSDKDDILKGLPIVILINSGSASASEIFSAALKENNRAIIVGEESFGKGSVQNVIPLPGEKTAIKLTVAKFYVNNKCIQYNGVTPDITVKPMILKDIPDYFEMRERDLSKEYQAAHKNDKKSKKPTTNQEQRKAIVNNLDNSKNEKEKEEDDPILLLYKPYSMEEKLQKDLQLIVAFNTVKAVFVTKTFANQSVSGLAPNTLPVKTAPSVQKKEGKAIPEVKPQTAKTQPEKVKKISTKKAPIKAIKKLKHTKKRNKK